MAIEVEYFRTGRHDCNRRFVVGEVIGPNVKDGAIDYFGPTTVDALCSSDEEYANFKVDIDNHRRVAVRLWEGETDKYIEDTSVPILLKIGQILQIGTRIGGSVDIRMQPAHIPNRMEETVQPVQIQEQMIEEV